MFAVESWDEPSSLGSADTSTADDTDATIELLLQQVNLHGPAQPASKPRVQPSEDKQGVAAPTVGGVELGFVYPYPEQPARPEHFPSKVGGAPVWLDPRRLPADETMHCGACARRLRFLMQLYCPRPEISHAYHRSIMLFCCGGLCLADARGWKALRCNLPEETPCYVLNPNGTFDCPHHASEPRCTSEAAVSSQGVSEVAATSNSTHNSLGLAGVCLPQVTSASSSATAVELARPDLPELIVSIYHEGDWAGALDWYAPRETDAARQHAEQLYRQYAQQQA